MRNRKRKDKEKIKDLSLNNNNTETDCKAKQNTNTNTTTGGLNKLTLFFAIFLTSVTAYLVLLFIKDTLRPVDTQGQNTPPPTEFTPTFQRQINVSTITVDGRVLTPHQLHSGTVNVYTIDNFLSEAECRGLMKAHMRHVNSMSSKDPFLCFDGLHTLRKHLQDVGKADVQVSENSFIPGTTCVDEGFSSQLKVWFKSNWSYSTAFYPEESLFTSVFEDRVLRATGLKQSNGGKFQVTSYPQGVGYKKHADCVPEVKETRDRVATILVYLHDVGEGGETIFHELGLSVTPRRGMALVWNNMDQHGRCLPESVHSANTVAKGRKFILQRWYYYESFRALGQRPVEPQVPPRSDDQAQVICDEYEQGSCRWYDEWNYSHLVDYVRQHRTFT